MMIIILKPLQGLRFTKLYSKGFIFNNMFELNGYYVIGTVIIPTLQKRKQTQRRSETFSMSDSFRTLVF